MGTKNGKHFFTCVFGKYEKKIAHSENFLPELYIQDGLSDFSGFATEWDKFQDIPYLTFPLHICEKWRSKDQASQWILPQRLNMKLLGRQFHTN